MIPWPGEKDALERMIYSPIIYHIHKESGLDLSVVAKWPERRIRAYSAWIEYQNIQYDKDEHRREVERAQARAKAKCGQNPPKPGMGRR